MSRLLILASSRWVTRPTTLSVLRARWASKWSSRVIAATNSKTRGRMARLAVRFDQPEEAARRIVQQYAGAPPEDGLDCSGRPGNDSGRVCCARWASPTVNSPVAVENCRSKLRQREILRDAGLLVPGYFSFRLDKRVGKDSSASPLPRRSETIAVSGQSGRDSRRTIPTNSNRRWLASRHCWNLRKFR